MGKWEPVYSYMHEGELRLRFLLEAVLFQVCIRKKMSYLDFKQWRSHSNS